jgi:hypothetical protein
MPKHRDIGCFFATDSGARNASETSAVTHKNCGQSRLMHRVARVSSRKIHESKQLSIRTTVIVSQSSLS